MGALTVDPELGDLRETILGDKEYTMSDGVLYSLVFLRELKVGDGSQLLIVFTFQVCASTVPIPSTYLMVLL